MLWLVVCSDIILVLRHLLVKGCTKAMPTKSQGLKWPFKQTKTYHTTSTMHYGTLNGDCTGGEAVDIQPFQKGQPHIEGQGQEINSYARVQQVGEARAQIVWIHLRTLNSIQNVRFELLHTGQWAHCRSSTETHSWLTARIYSQWRGSTSACRNPSWCW